MKIDAITTQFFLNFTVKERHRKFGGGSCQFLNIRVSVKLVSASIKFFSTASCRPVTR
jgi:hypothetical protein